MACAYPAETLLVDGVAKFIAHVNVGHLLCLTSSHQLVSGGGGVLHVAALHHYLRCRVSWRHYRQDWMASDCAWVRWSSYGASAANRRFQLVRSPSSLVRYLVCLGDDTHPISLQVGECPRTFSLVEPRDVLHRRGDNLGTNAGPAKSAVRWESGVPCRPLGGDGCKEWAAIGVLSLAILVGSIGAAYAYQNGAPATIATFDFAYVAFAVLWGVVIFQEVPSAVGAAGMFLIVFAGILAVRSKAKCQAPPNKGLQSDPAKLER